jgi:hypothetical protein
MVRTTQTDAEPVQLQELEVDLDGDTSELTFAWGGDVDLAVVLVEILAGEVAVDLTGLAGENLSSYKVVRLYLGRLRAGAKSGSRRRERPSYD